MKTIWFFLLSALAICGIALYGGPTFGIKITGENVYVSALIFSVILTLVNVTFGAIFRFISFPVIFFTFWLFSLVITFIVIYITDNFYSNIEITNPLGYIIIAIVPVLAGMMVWKK